jgi:hypothetical protein
MSATPDFRRIPASVAGLALAAALATVLVGGAAPAGTTELLSAVSVANDGVPFAGDGARFATVSPNGDGFRDAAVVHFRLAQPARVTLAAFASGEGAAGPRLVAQRTARLAAGSHGLRWQPRETLAPRTYMLRLTAVDNRGGRSAVGSLGPGDPSAHVVRMLGIDAGFTRPSYQPGARARLVVSTDQAALTLQLFRAGPETSPSTRDYGGDALWGVPVGPAKPLVWTRSRNRPIALRIRIPHAPSGLYFERLTGPDGQVGFAPFVLLPSTWGTHRTAVVFPTNTWQAYNHRDLNGDGWGDTWYAVRSVTHIDLTRPYLHRGVPTRFRGYQLGFLRWLYQSGKEVDFLSDHELESVSGERLRRLYRMLVFLGHHEYMTGHAYDSVVRFRDLGGSLIFTSTTNFLYQVELRGRWMIGRKAWRALGRPEAALIGVQYLDNDLGRHQGRYGVVGAATAPWAFAGTGLVNSSHFGHGGIEIDARAPASPPGTILLATMKNLHGPGRSAEMTYYSTPAGARVFASGTLNFAGTALETRVSALLENVWRHLLER